MGIIKANVCANCGYVEIYVVETSKAKLPSLKVLK